MAAIGTRWDYKDRGGVLNGVRKARVKQVLKNNQLLGYAVTLDVRDVDLSAADHPGLTLTLTLPGVPSGTFQAQDHRTCRVKTGKMDCR